MILSRNIAGNIDTCLNSHLSFRTDGVRTSQQCVASADTAGADTAGVDTASVDTATAHYDLNHEGRRAEGSAVVRMCVMDEQEKNEQFFQPTNHILTFSPG